MGNRQSVKIAAALLTAAVLLPAAERDPGQLLRLAMESVLSGAQRIPDYTCVQTVERKYYHPVAATLPRACSIVLDERRHPTPAQELRLAATDRLRLDVTLARGGEIFSWVGASHFEDAGIERIVHDGPFETGAFGSFLAVIFGGDVHHFRFEGKRPVDGRQLMEFSFRVLQNESHYRVKADAGWSPTGYSGSVFFLPDTGEVARLQLTTAELAPATGTCQTNTQLDYGKLEIGSTPFLLPAHSIQHFIAPNGFEVENMVQFTNCREYRGDSTITYNPPEPAAAKNPGAAANASPVPEIAAGLAFSMELLDAIDTDRAAAGDSFRAKLSTPLRDRKSKTLAPAGSIVEGRLRRVELFLRPDEVYVVLAPRWLSAGRARIRMAASRTSGKRRSSILLPPPWDAPAGAFLFPGQHVVIPKGLRSDWKTAEIPADRP